MVEFISNAQIEMEEVGDENLLKLPVFLGDQRMKQYPPFNVPQFGGRSKLRFYKKA